jgi:DNA-binding transcriptional LysR family regulator
LEIEVSKLPDLEGLAIFAKVVQTRSFVGAADDLRLSKATVSKAVGRIEKKFGTRLFNRTARRLAMTEAGRQLYERAAHILAEGEAAEDEVIAQSAVPRGRVRLTAPISFGVLHIAPISGHARPCEEKRLAPSAVPGWTCFIHPVSGVTPRFRGESCRVGT